MQSRQKKHVKCIRQVRVAQVEGNTPTFSHSPMLRMLGYSSGNPTMRSQFGRVNSTFAMDDVRCVGNETTLLDCPHTTQENCGPTEGAGVICGVG